MIRSRSSCFICASQSNGVGSHRQTDSERGSLSCPAGGADIAMHRLGKMFNDRQPQASAAQLTRTCFVHSIEALEDARQIGFRDTDARIGYFQAYLFALAPPTHPDTAA